MELQLKEMCQMCGVKEGVYITNVEVNLEGLDEPYCQSPELLVYEDCLNKIVSEFDKNEKRCD